MSLELEPSASPQTIEKLLAPAGLDWAGLLALPAAQQARLLRYLLPEPPVAPEEQAVLFELGSRLWEQHQTGGKIQKSLAQAVFDLFLVVNRADEAATIFSLLYPEPAPQYVTYYERAARLCLARGDNLGAWEAAIDLRRAFPTTLTTHSLLADLLLKMNDRAGARACYEAALELSQDSPRAWLGLAENALAEGNPAQAREIATKLESGAKISWRVLKQLAGLWHRLGDEAHAAQLDAAAQLWRERGMAAALEGKTGEGESNEASLPEGELLEGIKIQTPENFQQQVVTSQAILDPYPVLREVFGHAEFRPGQAEVISSVLAGQDTLAVLPTGGGKSLCYQLPALLLDRPVLVLSPLISLMKDQFDNLPPQLQAQSAVINSTLEPGEAARILRQMADETHKLRLVYAAPERLRQYPFVAAMAQAGLGLLVVDEAHCVTIWGNDFRPDYLFIRRALDDLAATGHRPHVLAVTATATPTIAAEISEQLGRPLITVRGTMHRPNLHYRVIKAVNNEEREGQLAQLCGELEGGGIVYVRSRDNAERLAYLLQKVGISAAPYHARLDKQARKRTHEEWSSGRVRVVVATVAFGMGIDKPDVRFIIHYNLADSVENYVQESGRAGRDGLPSECVLFYTASEKGNLTRFRHTDAVDIDMLRAIFKAVKTLLARRTTGLISPERLLGELNPGLYEYEEPKVNETQMRVGLSLLERAGMLTRHYDLPASAEITLLEPYPTGQLAELAATLPLVPNLPQEISLVALANSLECPLWQLEPLLLDWARAGHLRYRPASGKRDMLIELSLVPKDSNPGERIQSLLDKLEEVHERRVDQITDYAKTNQCRHVFLARHFGERLPQPCGVCDNCLASSGQAQKIASKSGPAKSEDFQLAQYYILTTLANLRPGGNIGKNGLGAILLGRESGPQTERSNPGWGQLAGKIKVKALEEAIGRLIEEGFIASQQVAGLYGQTYQSLLLSEKGRAYLEEQSANSVENAEAAIASPSNKRSVPGRVEAALETNQAALDILRCLATLDSSSEDGPKIGRTGLVRLLMGQPSALGTTASNPYKGILAGKFKEKEVEELITELVQAGYIEQQEARHYSGRVYQALRLSPGGRSLILED